MDVHTYLLRSERNPSEYPPLSRAELARHFQTTPESVEQYLGSAVRREGVNWVSVESGAEGLGKEMNLITEEGIVSVPITNAGDRSVVARHHAAISALERGNARPLHRLRRTTVVDANGVRHRLLTGDRELRRSLRTGELKGVQPY